MPQKIYISLEYVTHTLQVIHSCPCEKVRDINRSPAWLICACICTASDAHSGITSQKIIYSHRDYKCFSCVVRLLYRDTLKLGCKSSPGHRIWFLFFSSNSVGFQESPVSPADTTKTTFKSYSMSSVVSLYWKGFAIISKEIFTCSIHTALNANEILRRSSRLGSKNKIGKSLDIETGFHVSPGNVSTYQRFPGYNLISATFLTFSLSQCRKSSSSNIPASALGGYEINSGLNR